MRIEVFPGVYPPSEDTFLAVHALRFLGRGRSLLEVGCGSGYVSVWAAMNGYEVTAVDIDPKAVRNTLYNAYLNGVEVNAYVSDLLEKVDGIFDVILFNAPYLEPLEEKDPRWDGGRSLMKRFLEEIEGRCGHYILVHESSTPVGEGMLFSRKGFLPIRAEVGVCP